jgi:hypothetical protein
MNAPRLWNFARTSRRYEDFLSAVGNNFHNYELKNKEALGNFHMMGAGWILPKSQRLSN